MNDSLRLKLNEIPDNCWPVLSMQGTGPVSEEDAALISQAACELGASGSWPHEQRLDIYLPRPFRMELVHSIIRATDSIIPGRSAELSWEITPLLDADWATAWKVNFRGFDLGRSLRVEPDWEMENAQNNTGEERLTIWLRPGQGFGTGHHATTRLALETLERHLPPGAQLLDFGAGSAILCIAAIRLGAARATGIEVDEQAITNAQENIELNGLSGHILILNEGVPPENQPFECVICNMLPHRALPHMPRLVECLADSKSPLIFSGFLADQMVEHIEILSQHGLEIIGKDSLDEWGVLVATKRSPGPGS